MTDSESTRDAILGQVRRAFALNRTPGLHFPGNLLDLSFEEVSPQRTHMHLPAGPWCVGADGQMNAGALALVADIAMSGTVRSSMARNTRLGTVSMQLQFTGLPWRGPLDAIAGVDGFYERSAGTLGHTRVEVRGPDGLICHGGGTFMVLVPPAGMVLAPVPYRKLTDPAPAAVAEAEMTDDERVILDHATRTLRSGTADFATRFFGFTTRQTKEGATGRMPNGPHIGNRVKHVQGGISLAFGMTTASAALPGDWGLSNIASSYVSPGEGDVLHARAKIVHQGRATAVVRTQVTGKNRRVVLDVLTNHLRREGR